MAPDLEITPPDPEERGPRATRVSPRGVRHAGAGRAGRLGSETTTPSRSDLVVVEKGRRRASDYFWAKERDRDGRERPGRSDDETRHEHRDESLSKARARNERRIREADSADRKIIGKFLPSLPSAFFSCRFTGPDDWSEPEETWVEAVKMVATLPCPPPKRPTLDFGEGGPARQRNWDVIRRHGGDMTKVMEEQKGTTAWHGSEFRPVAQLAHVLRRHPNFDSLSTTFLHGMDYRFTRELGEEERKAELLAQLRRGNHNSADDDPEHLQKLLSKDVKHGFTFTLDADKVPNIKGAMVQPCGLADQFGMKSDGTRFRKKRLTHDLSFSITGEDLSVNQRVDMEQYPEMIYGWCFLRVVHFIVNLRVQFPNSAIFLAKFDYSDAFRKISHSGSAVAQTILVVAGVAYVMLRLSFGGSPNPPTFCEFSEMLTDLANEILCAQVDPSQAESPTVEELHTRPVKNFGDDEAFAPGIPPAVEPPTSTTSRVDCFVDDLILAFLGTAPNLKRACRAVPLAVHLMSRPHAGKGEPVPRRQLLEPSKLEAEGRPTELLMVLGWQVNTRALEVSLPADKFRAWLEDLDATIKDKVTTVESLESTIGRLNHASYLIPLSRHFLNRLRGRIPPGQRRKGQRVRLSRAEVDDLVLWRGFLTEAHSGMSMNLLTIRSPTRLGWSDSCPFGLAGYTQKGGAWRLKVPKGCSFYGDDTANNALEFLGLAVTALLLLHEAGEDGEKFPCLLSLSDSTSAIGWVFRSSRLRQGSRYLGPVTFIARHLANEVTKGRAQMTAQHLKGSFNDVADLMSFHGDVRGYTHSLTHDGPPDDVLTNRIRHSYPQIVTESFKSPGCRPGYYRLPVGQCKL